MFAINIKGRGIFKQHKSYKHKYPTVSLYETYEQAEKVIEYWDNLHCSFNHTVEYIHKKDKKGRNICEIIHTKLETTIVEWKE